MKINQYPIIFWVHSPIGYESFLAFKNQNNDSVVLHGSARNISTGHEIFRLGHPGLFQLQTPKEIDESSVKIKEAIEEIITRYGGYVLMIPQIAQPYLKILTKSDYCKGFGYYDEGGACYGKNFKDKTLPIYHKYPLKKSQGLIALCDSLGVDFLALQALYLKGVPFYDYGQDKILGSFSFFENAFPGKSSVIMPIPQDRTDCHEKCKDYSLILVGAIANGVGDKKNAQEHFSNINFLIRSNSGARWVIKPHPGDLQTDITQLIDGEFQMWEDFCKSKNTDVNYEPSFMGFKNYYSKDNSTIVYLKCMNRDNFLVMT